MKLAHHPAALARGRAKRQAVLPKRKPRVFRARIVNTEVADIVIKAAPVLSVGKRISFVKLSDLQRLERVPRRSDAIWRSGVIWRIEKNCLHLTRT